MNSDVNGEIAVMCAAEMGHGDDVKYLHQADFDIKVGGILGETADLVPGPGALAGSPGRVKSTFKYGDPLKIFVLMYKKILRKEIFHFEASYYPSQHTPHLPSSLS